MKTLITLSSLALFLLVGSQLKAQQDSIPFDTTTYIPFVAYWAVGDSFRYAVTEIKVTSVADSITTSDTVRYEADFVVVDSTAEGYTVVWDSKKSEDEGYDDFLEQMDDSLRTLVNAVGDVRMRFKTGAMGEYLGVSNVDDIRNALEIMAPAMVKYYLQNDTTYSSVLDERQQNVMIKFAAKKMMKEMTVEKMEEKFMPPVRHLLFPMGAEYVLYDTTEVSADVEARLPGKTVLQHYKYYFDDYFPEEGYVHMKVFTQLDDADGMLLVAESLRQQGFDENKIQDFVQNGYYLEREDNDYYYFYGYGLPEGVDCFKEVTAEAPDEKRVVTIQQYIIEIVRSEE